MIGARIPDFRITLDGKDLTSKIEPRLQALNISECRQDEADTLDLTLDDHDGQLAIPNRGAVLSVSIGWAGYLNKLLEIIFGSGLPASLTASPLVAGGVFGAGFYALAFGVLGPALRITPPLRTDPSSSAVRHGLVHVLFGVTTAVVADRVARRI